MQSTIPSGTPFQALFPDFKISTGFEVRENAVTGICEIFKERTDADNEYAIREIGVVFCPKGKEPTNEMVQQAIGQARKAAMNTLNDFLIVVGGAAQAAPVAAQPLPQNGGAPADAPDSPQEKPEPPNVTPQDVQPPLQFPVSENPAPPPVEDNVAAPDEEEAPPPSQEDSAQEETPPPPSGELEQELENSTPPPDTVSTVKKIAFSAELFPASNLPSPPPKQPDPQPEPDMPEESAPPEQDAPEESPPPAPPEADAQEADTPEADEVPDSAYDAKIKAARDVEITILGKANGCNGWKAGKLVDENPGIIIDMFVRYGNGKYTGDKVDQMAAIETLYSEALRKKQEADAA